MASARAWPLDLPLPRTCAPGRYVEQVRIEAARRQLESSTDTLDVIAETCGFGTAETLRRAFHRRLGVAPDSYRQRFRRSIA